MADLVLDAWAVMAWLKNQQPAADCFDLLLAGAARGETRLFMSIVNWGEIYYLCAKARDTGYAERVLADLRTRIGSISVSGDLVMLAAHLKARHAISYADAFAAATAKERGVAIVTGDPELRTLAEREPACKIQWLAD